MTTKILVTGGREYADAENVSRTLDRMLAQFPDMELVVGDAKGADKLAFEWAKKNEINVHWYPAKWKKHDKAGGPLRNQEMLTKESPRLAVAFPGGRGTQDMVNRLKASGVPTFKA